MDDMRFERRVAIVTGGGRGMGRAHCLELARRGAKVVVNDLGTALDGSGSTTGLADDVVREIVEAGGIAVANGDSVTTEEGAAGIAKTAIDAFGRIDILVHNAGTATYAPFAEMSYQMYRDLVSVHLDGGFLTAKAVWPHMQRAGYGRIIFITSQAGLSGFPHMAHYGAAKTGLVGLSRSLAVEGAEFGIKANTLGVAALTRMMDNFFETGDDDKPDMPGSSENWWRRFLRPEMVSPVVAYLAHEECPITGEILDTSGGHVAFQFLGTTPGFGDLGLTAEMVRDNFSTIVDPKGYDVFKPASDFLEWRNGKIIDMGAE